MPAMATELGPVGSKWALFYKEILGIQRGDWPHATLDDTFHTRFKPVQKVGKDNSEARLQSHMIWKQAAIEK